MQALNDQLPDPPPPFVDILHVALNCLVRMCKESPSRWKLVDGRFHLLFVDFLASTQHGLHKLHPKLLEALNCFVHDDAAFNDFLAEGLVDVLERKLSLMVKETVPDEMRADNPSTMVQNSHESRRKYRTTHSLALLASSAVLICLLPRLLTSELMEK